MSRFLDLAVCCSHLLFASAFNSGLGMILFTIHLFVWTIRVGEPEQEPCDV